MSFCALSKRTFFFNLLQLVLRGLVRDIRKSGFWLHHRYLLFRALFLVSNVSLSHKRRHNVALFSCTLIFSCQFEQLQIQEIIEWPAFFKELFVVSVFWRGKDALEVATTFVLVFEVLVRQLLNLCGTLENVVDSLRLALLLIGLACSLSCRLTSLTHQACH